ncbi:MAG: 16S rRNA (cytosine(967)-C(5))-methyltransferase RsmB [Eubacteriales bacterium]
MTTTRIRDAREVALIALQTMEKQGAWSDGLLKKMLTSLDKRDAALATRLCFGVLQNRLLIDFYLGHFSKMPLQKMERLVLGNLRLGVYQILFMDKIPHNASVDSAVELTKKHCKNPKASGMVNGILRNFLRQLDTLPEIPETNSLNALSIRYSHPLALVELFAQFLETEELEAFLQANNSEPAMTAMVNTVTSSKEDVLASLQKDHVDVKEHPWLDSCFTLTQTGNVEGLSAFSEGHFYIQDVASRLAVICSGVTSGQRALDVCAAPGGKSMAMAIQMENQGEIISCDLHPHKKKLILAGAERLHLDCINAETVNGKDFTPQWEEAFDLVFVDAPCSGLGVIRKKPDIRYKALKELEDLPKIQREILENVCQYVKKGGTMVYATCTILPRENQEIVQAFCEEHPEFSLESFVLPEIGTVQKGYITLFPQQFGTDGFFMAKMRRNK